MSSDAKNPDAHTAGTEPHETFKPPRDHILAAIVMFLISLIAVGAAPMYLFWVLFIPLIFIFWVLRSSTVVDSEGITINYAFRGKRFIPWDEFEGIGFKRSRTFARTVTGTEHPLPGVSFNSLPRLQAASFGRIPDALTAGRAAADEKVVIIFEDGHQKLISKEDWIARQKERGEPTTFPSEATDPEVGEKPSSGA